MKGWLKRVASALALLVAIAAGARLIYSLLVPVVPLLVCIVVVGVVLWVALGGRLGGH